MGSSITTCCLVFGIRKSLYRTTTIRHHFAMKLFSGISSTPRKWSHFMVLPLTKSTARSRGVLFRCGWMAGIYLATCVGKRTTSVLIWWDAYPIRMIPYLLNTQLRQVANGIKYLHDEEFVHCDIKMVYHLIFTLSLFFVVKRQIVRRISWLIPNSHTQRLLLQTSDFQIKRVARTSHIRWHAVTPMDMWTTAPTSLAGLPAMISLRLVSYVIRFVRTRLLGTFLKIWNTV